MSDIKFEINKAFGEISTSRQGWTKELNMVSWNGKPAKYDLRDWSPEHEKMGKGVTLSEDEARRLYEILRDIFE